MINPPMPTEDDAVRDSVPEACYESLLIDRLREWGTQGWERVSSLESALAILLADSIERHRDRCAKHATEFSPTDAEAQAQAALNR